MATYSYRSTLKRRRCSVKLSMRSMAGPRPSSRAWVSEIHLPSETRISPGELMERKQQENSSSSHHALISSAIWSSICSTTCHSSVWTTFLLSNWKDDDLYFVTQSKTSTQTVIVQTGKYQRNTEKAARIFWSPTNTYSYEITFFFCFLCIKNYEIFQDTRIK